MVPNFSPNSRFTVLKNVYHSNLNVEASKCHHLVVPVSATFNWPIFCLLKSYMIKPRRSVFLNQFEIFFRYNCCTGFAMTPHVPLLNLLISSNNVTLISCSWRNKRSSPTQPSFKTSFKISRISYREILLSDGTGKRFFLGNSAFHLNLEFSEILEDEPEICFTWLVAYFYCWSLQVLVKIKWSLRKRPIWTEAGQLLRSCFFSTIAGWRANPNPKFLIKIISKIIYKHFPKVKTKFSLSIHSISKLSISYLYLSISHSSQESIRTVFKHRQR